MTARSGASFPIRTKPFRFATKLSEDLSSQLNAKLKKGNRSTRGSAPFLTGNEWSASPRKPQKKAEEFIARDEPRGRTTWKRALLTK